MVSIHISIQVVTLLVILFEYALLAVKKKKDHSSFEYKRMME